MLEVPGDRQFGRCPLGRRRPILRERQRQAGEGLVPSILGHTATWGGLS